MKVSHWVTCSICNQRFDRDIEAYTNSATHKRRYDHATCALRYHASHPETNKPEIIDPTAFVTCKYCKKVFDKTKESFKTFSNGQYAHTKCVELEEQRELTEQEKLEKYIMQLFDMDYVQARIQKQINDYITNKGFTYSGIRKALVYFYEVKGNRVDKNKGYTIGIVPYIYDQAYRYYYSIWEAQQKQQYIIDASSLEKYVPKVREIHIPVPQRQPKKRSLFTFLDEEQQEVSNNAI